MIENEHEQGIRLLNTVLEEKSWDVLENNGIEDNDFHAEARQVLSQLRSYHQTLSLIHI